MLTPFLETVEKHKDKAFTLSEILLTLVIIGVVAAYTIPSLVNYTQDLEYKNAFKKTYAELSQAYNAFIQDEGGSLPTGSTFPSGASDYIVNGLNKNLNFVKRCAHYGSQGNCWPYTYYSYDRKTVWDHSAYPGQMGEGFYPGFQLPDKTLIVVVWGDPQCNQYIAGRCGDIHIDVNGMSQPNTMGKDIYSVHFFANKLIAKPDWGNSFLYAYDVLNGINY